MKWKDSIAIIKVIFLIIAFDACNVASSSSNTLKQGEFLNSSTFLISTNKHFKLGFLAIVESSDNTYLGLGYGPYINYTADSPTGYTDDPPVWIANRNEPIQKNSSGILSLTSTGDLVITRHGGAPINLYFSGGSGVNVSATATLTNSGMKLGKNMSLTSWFSEENPKEGPYTLEWNSTGSRLDLSNHGVVYWSSGELIDGKFKYIKYDPGNLNYIYHDDGEYFSYSIDTSVTYNDDHRRTVALWRFSYDGSIGVIPSSSAIAVADWCTGYNMKNPIGAESGCQLFDQPKCRNAHQNFSVRSGHFGPEWIVAPIGIVKANLSFGDCRSECWNNCECVGFQFYDECTIFKGVDLPFVQDLSGNSPRKYVLGSQPRYRSTKKMRIVIGSTISLLFLVCLGYLGMRHKKKEKKRKQEEHLFEFATSDKLQTVSKTKKSRRKGHDVKMFRFSELFEATDNFSVNNKIGQGGYGPVYKGKLSDGQEIAIKRLSKTSKQGVLEFKNELILIAKLQHKNLVRVLGCCIHKDEKMLVYEYMPNKSLDSFLFDTTKSLHLDWKTRLNIIEGIAQGLLYLHKYSRMRVIHRDLKAPNVLLDELMNPKIADFGLARIFTKDESQETTGRIVGTRGYMPPEYVMGGTFSVKSDVFSFGVLTIEIVSGRRNSSFDHLGKLFNLIGFAWALWREGEALQLKDERLLIENSDGLSKLLRTIQVGLLCVQENATTRPDMSDVVTLLSNDSIPLPIPLKPAFYIHQDSSELVPAEGASSKCSNNQMSISTLEARF